MASPLIKKVDCVMLHVPDLETGIRFYGETLGHELKWRTDGSAGFKMGESDTELVIDTSRSEQETDLLVESVDHAIEKFKASGSVVDSGPFDIPVGRCAVVRDPWGNRLVLLDLSKGLYQTDSRGNIIGVRKRVASDI